MYPYNQPQPPLGYYAMPSQHMHQQPHPQHVPHAAHPHQLGPLPMPPPAAPQLSHIPTMAHAIPHAAHPQKMYPYNQPQPPWGYYAMPSQHMHQQPHPQHVPHAAPPHQPGPLPMSSRPAAPQLPGAPTMAHAIAHPPHAPQPPPSISSPPPTPSTANAPRLNTNAPVFVPGGRSAKITTKSQDGMEVALDALRERAREESARKDQERKDAWEHMKEKKERRKERKEKMKKRNEEGATRTKEEEEDQICMDKDEKERLRKEEEERLEAKQTQLEAEEADDVIQTLSPASEFQESEDGRVPDVAPTLDAGFEPVVPLELPANCWVPASTASKVHHNIDSPELIVSKVTALLNKLTTEKFESISDQIIHWANKSVNEKDGWILIPVIQLVFERATDEPGWSDMHARLCQKMMEHISPEVQDDGIKNSDCKPIAGGQLFRKYLVNLCQEYFERGWFSQEAAAAAAAAKASDDQATKAAHETMGTEEAEFYFDEYYAVEDVQRQRLGLIKFIGELFKLQMLNERIIHECVKTLLGNVENPDEVEIESLCQLLKTVGQLLDRPKARALMDVYFTRMEELRRINVSSRIQFMLQDVFELRDRRWVGRDVDAAPTTFAAVYEAPAYRLIRISRGLRPMIGEPDEEQFPDCWAVASGSVPLAPPKLIDLSQFHKGAVKDSKREAFPQTNLSSDMFHMLNPTLAPAISIKPSRLR
ncbi:armadillo-type protein [Suillus lakei]|nr:armadillo-type protein [Suillus lakei]